jgi:Uri superfamily endonuclease
MTRSAKNNLPGTYALIFHCASPFRIRVGKLGIVEGSHGYWIYVGSAFGPGGLASRLAHHLKPSQRPHWHLDYLKTALRPMDIWTTTDPIKRECAWARCFSILKGSTCPISGFGASDCNCRSHLIHRPRRPGFVRFRRQLRQQIANHGPLYRISPADILTDKLFTRPPIMGM